MVIFVFLIEEEKVKNVVHYDHLASEPTRSNLVPLDCALKQYIDARLHQLKVVVHNETKAYHCQSQTREDTHCKE